MGMGEFNSDDHYIYYCGQESLKRNAVLECNLKNDSMILVHFQGKPFNITVSDAEEAEVDRFYEDLLEVTPTKDVLFITGDWNAKAGNQEITRIMKQSKG